MIYTLPDFINEGEGACAAGGISAGDAGSAAASAVSGGEAAVPMQDCPSVDQVAIDTTKVLGKCDHKHDGYMGKNCFHIPKKVIPTLHRWELCNGGSKRKKGKNGKDKKYYTDKGMKVITSYEDLVEALDSSSKPVFVFNIPHDKISSICDQEQNDNSRFNKQQFMKLISNTDVEFVGLFTGDEMKQCLALAAICYDVAGQDDCYINEVLSFKKGYGKALVLRILSSLEKTWLLANPTASDGLVKFYRDSGLGLKETVIKNSIWDGKDAHFFYTDDCDEDLLIDYINRRYARCANEDEDNSPSSIIHQGKTLAQWEKQLKGEFTISQLVRMAMSGCDILRLAANINGVTSLEDSEQDPFKSMMNMMNNKDTVDINGVEFDVKNDEESRFDKVLPDETVPAANVFFINDFSHQKKKHIYTISVTSMNQDESLEFDDLIVSDKMLSFNDIVEYVWPRLPKGYNIKGDFSTETREYLNRVRDAKENLKKTGSADDLMKIAVEPFPILSFTYGNSTRDMIKVTPIEEDFNVMTSKGIPAAYVVSDNNANFTFNKPATDRIYMNQVIGESKNKVTRNPEVKQYSFSKIKPALKIPSKKTEKAIKI